MTNQQVPDPLICGDWHFQNIYLSHVLFSGRGKFTDITVLQQYILLRYIARRPIYNKCTLLPETINIEEKIVFLFYLKILELDISPAQLNGLHISSAAQ